MKVSLVKSYRHDMSDSFSDLAGRLKSAGYPDCFLEEVAESLMSKLKIKRKAAASRKNTKPVIITYSMSQKDLYYFDD